MTQKERYELSRKIAEVKESGELETYGEVVSRLDKAIQNSENGVLDLENEDEVLFIREEKKAANNQSLSDAKIPDSGVTYTIKTTSGYTTKVFVPNVEHIVVDADIELPNGERVSIEWFYNDYIAGVLKDSEQIDKFIVHLHRTHFGETWDTSSDTADLKVKRLEVLESSEEIVVTDFLSMAKSVDIRKV